MFNPNINLDELIDPSKFDNPIDFNNVNVGGTLNMLKACVDYGVNRFVYSSSSSVYGDHPELPKQEAKVGSVLSPYAATKKIDEIFRVIFTGIKFKRFLKLRQNARLKRKLG